MRLRHVCSHDVELILWLWVKNIQKLHPTILHNFFLQHYDIMNRWQTYVKDSRCGVLGLLRAAFPCTLFSRTDHCLFDP